MLLHPSAAPAMPTIFSLLILGQFFFFYAEAAETWQLNTAYTLTQSNFTSNITGFLEENTWQIKEYPGFYIFLILRGEVLTDSVSITSSAYLCLLAFSSVSSPQSMSDFSFTLSIYLYDYHLFDRGAIVWTANHNRPISSSNSTSVHLLPDGNLVLLGDDPQNPFWSSNTANQGVSTMNISQNPVSLVLQSSHGDIVWQSADNPTDILTMGQFLQPGRNLTSWKSPTDPSSGAYTLVMEPGGLALYSNFPSVEPYWIWSIYGINDSFSVKHTCTSNPLAAFMEPDSALKLRVSESLLDNASHWLPFCSLQPNYSILPFEQYGTALSSLLLILRLEYDGRLRAYNMGAVWSNQLDIFNSDSCLLPDYCGPYGVCTSGSQCTCPANNSYFTSSLNMSHGCSRTNKLDCNASSQTYQIMLPLSGVEYIPSSYTPPLLNITTEQTCVDKCSQNCSCVAAFWLRDKAACHHHVNGDIKSLRGGLNQSDYFAYLKVNAIRQPPGRASKTTIIVASVVSSVSVLAILVLLSVYYTYKQLKAEEDDDEDTLLDSIIPGLPSRYTYKELEQITNGFEKQLGRGGFGTVYAGLLPNGSQVAVKQLESLRQGIKEFKSEVAVMGGIHHNNLLDLLGFCSQKGHRLLVYEFMGNGSLDQWLFADAHKRSLLTWDVRCKIALGTARGLAYLHDDCREKIIHLDIKPQNILLDESFNAKVADFGLSRLVNRNETHVMTTMRGTPGYLAPDWVKEGVIDEKCDVYSFGMLLMEIISGRKNFDHTVESTEQAYYPEWAFWQAQQGDLTKLTDTALDSEEQVLQLRRMINTAFLCVLENPALRPSMQNVVQMLQGHIPVDEVQLSSLHQGLLFVLKSPSSWAITRIGEALQGLLRRSTTSSEAAPLLQENNSGRVMSSFSILSGR